jgi:hypothetical protein
MHDPLRQHPAIHPSAWKEHSPNFGLRGFSEVRVAAILSPLASLPVVVGPSAVFAKVDNTGVPVHPETVDGQQDGPLPEGAQDNLHVGRPSCAGQEDPRHAADAPT